MDSHIVLGLDGLFYLQFIPRSRSERGTATAKASLRTFR